MGSSSEKNGARRGDELLGCVVSGRYRIKSLLAVGGMGEVYLAEHVHIRKELAIKVLRHDVRNFMEMCRRFEREAIAGAHIDHPHIASAFDFGWLDDGSCFVAQQYVEGETLQAILQRGPLAPSRARHVARQVASALAACHGLGVLHRDIKPGNIMVDADNGDHVRLIDFGLARVHVARVSNKSLPPPGQADDPTTELNLRGIVCGTVTYMPPEITRGMDAIDERSDLYSLGVVLYEMLAGRPPFDRSDPAIVMLQKRTSLPPPIDMPPDLAPIVTRLLSASPEHRFQSAEELLAAFDAGPDSTWQRASSTLRTMPAVMVGRQPMERAVPIRRAIVVSAIAMAVVAAGLWLFDRNLDTAAEPLAASSGLEEVVREIEVPVTEPPSEAERQRLREDFVELQRRGKVAEATKALRALITRAPSLLGEAEVRTRAGALIALHDFGPANAGPGLIDALVATGPPGYDVLYEVLSTRGGTEAATRATAILARPDIRTRLDPALTVALELREARCRDKPSLFERAATDGDERALIYLKQLRSRRCKPRIGQCCFHGDRRLAKAIRKLAIR